MPTRPISSSCSPRPGSRTARAAGSAKISAFLVDIGAPGFTLRRGPPCVSHRGYHQCELFFDDCFVPEAQLLGREGARLRFDERMARVDAAFRRRDQRRARAAACSRRRSTGRRRASSSARRSAASRAFPSSSPTWRRRSRRPTCSLWPPRTSSIREPRAKRISPWPSCSLRRLWRASPTEPCRFSAAWG